MESSNYCNYRDNFCMVCGLFAPKDHHRRITQAVQEAYKSHFGDLHVFDRPYIPQIVCTNCYTDLLKKLPTT